MIKKTLKITLIILFVLLGAAFALPIFFKDKIVAKVKSAINKNINAKVDFTSVDISLFRHFPKVSVALENLQVTGMAEFENDTLLASSKIDMALNLISVIKGEHYEVYSINLDSPRIHAIMTREGKANWDIVKADSSAAHRSSRNNDFKMELHRYSIVNGYVLYQDVQSMISSEISDIDHEGSGDFTSDLFMLKTSTSASEVNVTLKNVPYLSGATLSIDADFQVNNKTNTYQFETDNIMLNGLQLATKGFVQIPADSSYTVDIAFNAPSTDFKTILSLVPAIYKHDFDKIRAGGTVVFNGFVKGKYDDNHLPAYLINLAVKNGSFQYPDLPKPVKNINLAVNVSNPDGVTDHTIVDIPQAHIEMENEPFDFRMLLKNPVSDPFIDAAAKGKIDLSKITQFIKLDNGTKFTGIIQADVSAKGTVAAMEQQRYEQFIAAGTVAVNSLYYASNDYPDGLKVNSLFMTFNPKDISITDLEGQYKKSNLSLNGSINGLLPYLLRDKILSGKLNLKVDNMNLNDWMGTSTDTTTKNTTAAAPFVVPANINFFINADIARLIYDKLEIGQLSGNVTMKDEGVTLNNISGNALDGTMLINANYYTKISKKKQDIFLNYDVSQLDVQKTFYAFNTVQKLMPLGQYLSGKITSQLKVDGKLSDNMMPDLRSLTGEGNFLLIEGFLKKFAPLEKLAELLNINELKEITLRDVKNYMQFNNGMILVKPFTVKIKDVEMEIGGMQGLDQSLDYIINLKVPRALMGSKGNALVNNLLTQVNNRGIPLQLGEKVNLHVKLGGTIKQPAFNINLKEAAGNAADQLKQQAGAFAQAKIDSTKKAFKDTALSVRKQLEKDVQEELQKRIFGNKDTSNDKAGSNLDSSKKRLEATGRGLLKDLLKKKQPVDSVRQ
ncbi:MAG: AsmA-like C-terminal region-containing protein [Chitinophagaceae bacterium]